MSSLTPLNISGVTADHLCLMMNEGLEWVMDCNHLQAILRELCKDRNFSKCNDGFAYVLLSKYPDEEQTSSSVNDNKDRYRFALNDAIFYRQHSIAEQLIKARAADFASGSHTLGYAVLYSDTAMVELLLQHGANVNSICTDASEQHSTALIAAAADRDMTMVNVLLQA